MEKQHEYWTTRHGFFGNSTPFEITEKYGSPVFVYNENILRERCREMKGLVTYPHFNVNYSTKANSNVHLLKIIKDEGLHVDAMSPGEIYVNQKAGFKNKEILYISNNVSAQEMKYAIERDVLVSIDSVSQLHLYGKLNPGGNVALRFNAGIGAGHHAKVITAGKNTKFGIDPVFLNDVKECLVKYKLNLVGINHHIGSLFLDGGNYVDAAKSLLDIARHFPDIKFIDLGGGFGVPYNLNTENRLNLMQLGQQLDDVIGNFVKEFGKEITFKIEPGRYIAAECGLLLGTVHSVKHNYGDKYVGTDLGFNLLARPIMYNSYHEIEVYPLSDSQPRVPETATIVGNICETGDVLAQNREIPKALENDAIAVLHAGAYGFVMSSNYNNRLRPAEVLINSKGQTQLIRKTEQLEDLMRFY